MSVHSPDAIIIHWAIQTSLSGGCPGEGEIVDHVVGMATTEAEAAGVPLSGRFVAKLRTLVFEELQITLSEAFSDRLCDLCAEEQRELLIIADWKQVGF
jgi:hypothetical protein